VTTTETDIQQALVVNDADLQFSTKKFTLLSLLDKAAQVLPSKDTNPVLKNFQVEVTDHIRIVATDLELSVVASTRMANIGRPGTAVFPGRRLLELTKEAPDVEIVFNVSEGKAEIMAGRASWELRLMNGDKYPPLPVPDDLEYYTLDRGVFLDALNHVRYAAATEALRPSLMVIDITKKVMRASDGVRFQQVLIPWWPDGFDMQIPIAAVDDLVKLLRGAELGNIEVAQTDDHIVFRLGSDVFIVSKIETEAYPDMESTLLKPAYGNQFEMTVGREDFISAIKRVRVTADPESNSVVLALSKDKLHVQSRDKYGNTGVEELDVSYGSPEISTAFNHSHLLDLLMMTNAPTCTFKFGPSKKKTRPDPILLSDEGAGLTGILNQVRLDWD
jgi:DNA polymerase III subunit beta